MRSRASGGLPHARLRAQVKTTRAARRRLVAAIAKLFSGNQGPFPGLLRQEAVRERQLEQLRLLQQARALVCSLAAPALIPQVQVRRAFPYSRMLVMVLLLLLLVALLVALILLLAVVVLLVVRTRICFECLLVMRRCARVSMYHLARYPTAH